MGGLNARRKKAQAELAQRALDHRRMLVAEYTQKGVRNHAEIARRLLLEHGISVDRTTVSRDKKALEQVYREVAAAAIETERGITARRFEMLQERNFKKLEEYDRKKAEAEANGEEFEYSDLPTIRMIKEIEESRRKMLGLDKPSKIAHTNPEGDEEYKGGIPKSFWDRLAPPDGGDEGEIVDAEIIPEIEGG